MAQKTILISGGTGMVGGALAKRLLEKGNKVIILTRDPSNPNLNHRDDRLSYAAWDIDAQTIDTAALSKADALVHLAGAGVVAKPWTDSYKREIIDSRVKSSRLLVNAIKQFGAKLKTVVSASAVGWYGEDIPGNTEPFKEEAPASGGFLGETCALWEESIKPVMLMEKRLVICRIGIVLSNMGGALQEFKVPLKFRVAGILGNGKQVISWIHIDDLCGILIQSIENETMEGIFNAAAPQPVTNRHLTTALAKSMYGNHFISLPVPSLFLKIMMGERSVEVLKSTTVSATKILNTGFNFAYPSIEKAMAALNSKK